MRTAGILLFWTSLTSMLVFAWMMFPTLNVNVLIIHIPLIGWAAWQYGRTVGLLVALLLMLFAAFLISFAYADIVEYYMANVSGTGIYTAVALITGKSRANYDQIKQTNLRMDHLVACRDQELSTLTWRLLNTSEKWRARQGRKLHDGIGQQLTGVRLLAASLQDQLEEEGSPNVELAEKLTEQVSATHDLIRGAARLLFPVRISEAGLIPAFMELIASIKEIKQVDITITNRIDSPELPNATALQLYRICQEIAIHTIDYAQARHIRVTLAKRRNEIILSIEHDGPLAPEESASSIMRLIDYRLKQISGRPSRSRTRSRKGFRSLAFAIPTPKPPTKP